jgi:hypothetical protein
LAIAGALAACGIVIAAAVGRSLLAGAGWLSAGPLAILALATFQRLDVVQ